MRGRKFLATDSFKRQESRGLQQFCRIFGKIAECDAVFCRILSIRHIYMQPVEAKINKH